MWRSTLVPCRRMLVVSHRPRGAAGAVGAEVGPPAVFFSTPSPLQWSAYRHLSITYSGGQPTEGQGGYYGSGGARAMPTTTPEEQAGRPELLALAGNVDKIKAVMKEVQVLENLLRSEEEGGVSNKTIEIRSSMKKLITSPDFMECLNRLEFKGEPVWGLSSEERDLIHLAREKVKEA